MAYFISRDHWIYHTAAEWSPLRRWTVTTILVAIIIIPWWFLSFRHILKDIRTYKKELAAPLNTQGAQQLEQQRNDLQAKLKILDQQHPDHIATIINAASHSKIMLDECDTHKTDNPIGTHLIINAHGRFDQIHQFFKTELSPHLVLKECSIKRLHNQTLECHIEYDVVNALKPLNPLPIH